MQNDDTTVAQPSATSSNTQPVLAELAERAGRHYGQSTDAWLKCGRVLLEARRVAQRGEWGAFLQHAGVPLRTGQSMVRIAGYVGESAVKHEIISRLGVRGTLDFLTAVDHAMENWRAARDAVEHGSELHRELIQSPPDSLWAVLAWVDTGRDKDAIRAACGAIGIYCPPATAA